MTEDENSQRGPEPEWRVKRRLRRARRQQLTGLYGGLRSVDQEPTAVLRKYIDQTLLEETPEVEQLVAITDLIEKLPPENASNEQVSELVSSLIAFTRNAMESRYQNAARVRELLRARNQLARITPVYSEIRKALRRNPEVFARLSADLAPLRESLDQTARHLRDIQTADIERQRFASDPDALAKHRERRRLRKAQERRRKVIDAINRSGEPVQDPNAAQLLTEAYKPHEGE